jgi:NAD(P)H-dependent flavin oxidoreductase YrpB (nitropropane dioxygenase family)
MPLPPVLQSLPLPIIGAPLFIISNPKLVVAQCTAGVVGAMPALNARPAEQLDEWLADPDACRLDRDPRSAAALFAVNQIKNKQRRPSDMQVRQVQGATDHHLVAPCTDVNDAARLGRVVMRYHQQRLRQEGDRQGAPTA